MLQAFRFHWHFSLKAKLHWWGLALCLGEEKALHQKHYLVAPRYGVLCSEVLVGLDCAHFYPCTACIATANSYCLCACYFRCLQMLSCPIQLYVNLISTTVNTISNQWFILPNRFEVFTNCWTTPGHGMVKRPAQFFFRRTYLLGINIVNSCPLYASVDYLHFWEDSQWAVLDIIKLEGVYLIIAPGSSWVLEGWMGRLVVTDRFLPLSMSYCFFFLLDYF